MTPCGPNWTSTAGVRETGSSRCPAGPRGGHQGSVQLPGLERMGTTSGTAGVLPTVPLEPACALAAPERGGSVTTNSPLHTWVPYWTVFLLTCFLLQQVPPHGPGGSAHGDLVSTVPSDRGRHRCPLFSFPRAALREGAGETPVFKAPSHFSPPRDTNQAQATQAPWKAAVYWDEKCAGPVKETTGGSDLKTLVPRILVGSVLTEHFTCQWNSDF